MIDAPSFRNGISKKRLNHNLVKGYRIMNGKTNMLFIFEIIFVISCISLHDADAATIFAESCSGSDVQSAINSAIDGDVVIVPAGTCTWENSVTFANKGITIQGAGIDQTTIIDETSSMSGETPFSITTELGDTLRISGITLNGKHTIGSGALLALKGDSKAFRIDHCKFDSIAVRAIQAGNKNTLGGLYGVIDHCTFVLPYNGEQGVTVTGDGDSSWVRPLSLGTANAVYVEDCTFNLEYPNDACVEGYNGARIVVRYSTLMGPACGAHGLDSGNYRSTYSYEIYNNTISRNGMNTPRAMHFRGGTGVIFNNTILGDYTTSIGVTSYRTCCGECPNCTANCSPAWGRLDGSNNGDAVDGCFPVDNDSTNYYGTHAGSSNIADTLYDTTKDWSSADTLADWKYYIWNITDNSRGLIINNTDTSVVVDSLYGGTDNDWDNLDEYKITNGWPGQDQVGRSTDSDADGYQDMEPFYEWNNTVNDTDANIVITNEWGCENPSVADHIRENRDFYNDTPRPGYTPYVYPHPLTQELAFSYIWDQAETQDIIHPLEVVVDENSGAGCDRFIWLPLDLMINKTPPYEPAGEADFEIEIEKSGDYVIWGRTLAPDENSNSFFVSVDEGQDEIWEVQTSDDWTWDLVNVAGSADRRIFGLSSGSHTLKIKGMEVGAKLDMTLVTNDMVYVPSNILEGPPCPPTGLKVIEP